jgi:hypothetical protein
MILITLLGDDLSILTPVIYEFKDQIAHLNLQTYPNRAMN